MHEPEAIEGMIKIIKRDKPTILIEILNDDVGKKVESLISSVNYNFYNVNEKSGLKKVEKLTKSTSFNFLLTKNILN